jgi:hypothetical protein
VAKVSIKSEDVYQAVKDYMANGKKRSYSDLAAFIEKEFGANSNQIAGLIFRMHSSKKILTKLKDEKGYYIAHGKASITEDITDQLEKLIVNSRKTLIEGSLNVEVPNEDINLLRTIIPKLEAIHKEMQR